jgi:hypothetical protein
MRPCNQCRQPVENNVLICDDCKRWVEQENGDHPRLDPATESQPTDVSGGDMLVDHSYSILMVVFSCIVTALFALVGLAVNDWTGFLIGGGIGLVSGIVIFVFLIRF